MPYNRRKHWLQSNKTNKTKLKAEVFARYNLNPCEKAQRFHGWTYRDGESPSVQSLQLVCIVKGWLGSTQSIAELLMTITVDKCLRELPPTLLRTVTQSNPQTMDALVRAIETCRATESIVEAGRHGKPGTRSPTMIREGENET